MVSTVDLEQSSLPRGVWRDLLHEHDLRAGLLIGDHVARRARHETHPVWDFLFTYYSYKPALLRRWHPGLGAVLLDASDAPHRDWRWYGFDDATNSVTLATSAFLSARHDGILHLRTLLAESAGRPGRFDCFGMHEWAMVYRQDEHRHDVPLRLGQAGTDAVVEAHELRCTHYDAYRFFTSAAAPRNLLPLVRVTQVQTEQPGCLHAGMDLYKWAMKLGPLVPGAVLLDAFELARDIRRLDMEASPYDLRAWGFAPVQVETPAGKAEYVRRQRAFADRAQHVRTALLTMIDRALRLEAVHDRLPLRQGFSA